MGNNDPLGAPAPVKPAFNLTELDHWILKQTDETFKKHDWEELKHIIGESNAPSHGHLRASSPYTCANHLLQQWIETNNISVFRRTPSDLQRYLDWTAAIKIEYGSITNFLLTHRLPKAWGEPPFTPQSTTPFQEPSDYKVLLNDWPYALDPGITHIIVWTRTPIATDDDKGDLVPESRALIQAFVQRYFIDTLGPGGEDKVVWFKNWVALQSVRSLEHFHVIVRDVDDDMLEKWTGERPKRG